jgi:hypothetical protein
MICYRLRGRRLPPPPPVADVADEAVDRILGTQWPGAPLGVEAGWPQLARALLACAVLDAGVTPRRGYGAIRPTVQTSARRYLLEADADVPLPLETACALANFDVTTVRAIVRLRLP